MMKIISNKYNLGILFLGLGNRSLGSIMYTSIAELITSSVQALAHNVRRDCGVVAESRWRVFLHSWCDAGMMMVITLILALAKTVTPGGESAGEARRIVAPATKRFSLVTQLSRHGEAMTYTDLLGIVVAYEFLAVQLWLSYQNVVANESQLLITRVTAL
ncbi:MAG: hypothetical protein U5L72_18145 [Bacteroidales bacterium]|nr:hypothetical protein [Bacteroidales bacterium]